MSDPPARSDDHATTPFDEAGGDATTDLGASPAPPDEGDAPLPERLGRYRILSLLGQGGMGVVYEAEQETPRRRVALKVIRGGAFLDDVRRRLFQREAESLGRLKHPGIAAIYEAGRTEDGQPYFAMELVRGRTLSDATELPPERRLTRDDVRRRLRLLRRTCEAVNYAHQRGVIHRDLKPQNILVADVERDGLPEIKILDFGVAKIVDPDVQESLSHAGTLRGTIAYMSPEQLSGDPAAVDARSDVYALGVVLYAMLAGRLPFDPGSSLASAIREVAEKDPKPIRRVWRGKHALDADLETIVQTAMHRDPERRYATAAALADDIERYLARQPILARPASAAYQLRKLVERNKLATAALAAFVLLIAGFGAWMTVLYQRARTAEAASAREATTANEISDFMVGLFAGVDPRQARGNEVTARELLDLGAERITDDLADQPDVQARLMATMGWSYNNLGLRQEARALREKALDIEQTRLGPDDPHLGQYLHDLSVSLDDAVELDAAKECSERAIAAFTAVGGPRDHSTLAARERLAAILEHMGRPAEARAEYEEVLQLHEGQDEDQFLGSVHNDLGTLLKALGETDAAIEHLRKSMEIYARQLEPDNPLAADPMLNLSAIYGDLGRFDEALELTERGNAIQEKTLGPDHPDVIAQKMNLAILHDQMGQANEAEAIFRQTVDALEKSRGPEHPVVAQALGNLGFFYQSHGRPEDAIPVLERSLRIRETAFGETHPAVSLSAYHLANSFRDAGRYDEAAPLYLRAIAIDSEVYGPESADVADDSEEYAALLRATGDTAAAERTEAKVTRIRAKLEAADAGAEETE